MLASLRGDRVIAVDANPDRGTLSDKLRLETAATVRDLLNNRDKIYRYADVRGFTSQNAARDQMDLATDLQTRLPRTRAAMAAGLIDEYRARLIWRPTRHLTDADAARADEILAALAPAPAARVTALLRVIACSIARGRPAHRHAARAAVDGPHLLDITKADQRPAIVGILAQQAVEQQLVEQLAVRPGVGADDVEVPFRIRRRRDRRQPLEVGARRVVQPDLRLPGADLRHGGGEVHDGV